MDYKKQPKVRSKETGRVKEVMAIHYDTKDVCVGKDLYYFKFDEIEFITDDEEPTKVSSCCGAEVLKWSQFISISPKPYTCKSCGEPCEAVPEELKWQPGQKHKQALELNDYINDTKPDPIEPIEIREYGDLKVYSDDEVAEKLNDVINALNYLLSKHE